VEGIEDYPYGQTGLEGTGTMQSGLGADRVIYYIVRSAIEGLAESSEADIRRIFRLFARKEQNHIIRILKQAPLLVHFGYPRREQLPDETRAICAIVLGNESMENAFLDGFIAEEDADALDENPFGSQPAVVYGEIDRFDVGCWFFTDHHDLTYYYHRIVRSILIGALRVLLSAGLQPVGMTSADVRPAPEYLPEHPFWRQLTYTVRGSVVSAISAELITKWLVRVTYEGSEDLVEVIASGDIT
jgi:hypothetical protein